MYVLVVALINVLEVLEGLLRGAVEHLCGFTAAGNQTLSLGAFTDVLDFLAGLKRGAVERHCG